ncbi:HDIG domain-containing metalloprotein [Entomospira culicis]|uniref:HDIG domain-containing protein n=1 Tax=Entomospira culicis TaxID=2719989 RepID=A0A968GEI5_9SPIO|nr:HDIG domain-containing metalloprotein [Entomospira culicis]NIZ18833.1 HDIG domain-containing protein [Entomospira culicis]NIZ69048.1 HDIG domain-containing protein [Entomospira culicis]WDI37636.1 HDIG domain-containing protein [Entomospira culicis]WDI39264.1 HDIG domain-containing protein [Entomospira culicis]
MFKRPYHAIFLFMNPLLRQKYYLLTYLLLQALFLMLILTFAQGRPIWHNIHHRYSEQSNHALIPVYHKRSSHQSQQHFAIVRQSVLQSNNPSLLLRQVLASPQLDSLELNLIQMEQIYTISEDILAQIYAIGYTGRELPREAERGGFVLIREDNHHDMLLSAKELLTIENIHGYIDHALLPYDLEVQLFAKALIHLFLQPNLNFTNLERHQITEISPILLQQEQIGSILYMLLITAAIIAIIHALYREAIIKLDRLKPIAKRYYMILAIAFIALISTFFILTWQGAPYRVPAVMMSPAIAVSFAITLLFGYRIGLLFSLHYLLIFALAVRFDMLSIIYLLMSMPVAIYLAHHATNRNRLFLASFWQALLQALAFFILAMVNATEEFDLPSLMVAIVSGLLVSPVALTISPIVERMLNLPTNYRLLDLCNLNAPTLRRLQYLAPGTYTHSLNVAILAENACQHIGAKGLLARVGAYYHDIGKMENPEYFVENQQKGTNKHNSMRANLSAAMIRSHVRIGYEMGKEIRLPQEVLDIISEHHGESLVSFFYTRAKEELSDPEQSINEADFRYSGPRPRSKESAIVMLADSVEAASHTLKKPNQTTIAKLVDDIISHKIETKELQDSPLALKDLGKIKFSLVQSLIGQYHHRIEYPKGEKE